MPTPVPTATSESGTGSQEELKEFLEGLDANSIIEGVIAAIEESPIFRAIRTQTVLDGSREIFDAVYGYGYTGGPVAYLTAQGTLTTPSIGRIFEYDSTWHSTCVRKIAPRLESWQYYEHDHWYRLEGNLDKVLPAVPFFSLFIDFAEWEAVDLYRQGGPLVLVLQTVVPGGISYTAHIHPREHRFRVVVEKSYFDLQRYSDTAYLYDIEKGPAVHESEEDCLSRNAG